MSMRSVLIVEDDTFKLERIEACLKRLSNAASVTVATSVQAAVNKLQFVTFDFVLLDMSLPTHDLKPGGSAVTSLLSGGLEVIMELSFLKRDDQVVIITQYPEIEIEGVLVSIPSVKSTLESMFNARVARVILYRHESSVWENDLMAILEAP